MRRYLLGLIVLGACGSPDVVVATRSDGVTVVCNVGEYYYECTPDDPNYNRPVRLPYAASHERLWREDDLYDLVLVLGHNDDPAVPGMGSAIFLHLTRPERTSTEGCVALDRPDLLELLAQARPGDTVTIAP